MTFKELNLSAPLLRAVQEAGYETPSPIQAAAIPPVLAGRDLMGCAQTGTGKTAAFALPMLDRLTANAPRRKGAVRALILTPTRELALQIGESFEAYGKYLKLRSTVIFGGVGQAPQVEALKDYNALYDEVMATDATLLAADAAARAAEKNICVSRQSWLPKLEIGYRRNTSLDEKSNGFLIGGSLPIFSNRKKHQIARAQAISAQYLLDNARLQAEAQVQSQFNEMQQLTTAMQAYDVELMHQTLDMLKEAVTAGQLSIIDYYTEADNVYRNLQAYMELENQYQKLMASIYKNRL
mgnify:FL=1